MDVEQRGLAGPGSAGNQNVAPRAHRFPQEERHRPGQAAESDQILVGQFLWAGNFRIVTSEPSSASGGITALTREPSSSRASTIGLAASMWRPSGSTMRWMIDCRWLSLLNFAALR